MRAGRAIREAQRHEAAAAIPCPSCGHVMGIHFELPYSTLALVDGVLVETKNPDHVAGVFHCTAAGCSCSITPTR